MWHAADTLPLVKVVDVWNWKEPWEVQSGSAWYIAAGLLPFLLRLLVTVGIAELATNLVKRLTGGNR